MTNKFLSQYVCVCDFLYALVNSYKTRDLAYGRQSVVNLCCLGCHIWTISNKLSLNLNTEVLKFEVSVKLINLLLFVREGN